ncbi:hypothetical protein [Polyangium sorediatum]|uniref:Uncharacterized protein n=1 Tax=Polyangium sorediatum TaxID=889274 RepID=A0ABT6PAV9_9BACT|nr:hypothetical protein [Polyangium sorediatum]MDI1437649.1 hypothetical protein [Polyangium sorediatum]
MNSPSVFSAVLPSLVATDSAGAQVLTGSGAVAIAVDGNIRIDIAAPGLGPGVGLSAIPDRCEINGTTIDGDSLTGHHAYATDASTHWTSPPIIPPSTDVSFVPTELLLVQPGADVAKWDKKVLLLKGPRVVQPETWKYGDLLFALQAFPSPRPGVWSGDVTAELLIERVQPVANFDDIRLATLALLSLASRTQTRCLLETSFNGTNVLCRRAFPQPGDVVGGHPLISQGGLANFMSQTMAPYLAQSANYSLDTAITYYCRSHQENLAEAKFIFAGVAMESLKFYWALNVARFTPDDKRSGLIRGFKKASGANYTFEELMMGLAGHLGLTHTYTFIEERNALFHTGRSAAAQLHTGSTWPHLRPVLQTVQD